jgi:hypothetical protein
MAEQSDYLIYQPPSPTLGEVRQSTGTEPERAQPLTEGLWQQETLGVLQLYADKASFSPVSPQASGF